ncbi:hypothetical protein [Exiguobacterium aurantiacum]|nr:hypothetical protein [Exiguobacterium aurantiacum]
MLLQFRHVAGDADDRCDRAVFKLRDELFVNPFHAVLSDDAEDDMRILR